MQWGSATGDGMMYFSGDGHLYAWSVANTNAIIIRKMVRMRT